MKVFYKTVSTPTNVGKLMCRKNVQGFRSNKPDDKRAFLREAYCRMLEEHLDNLGKREHWGKTLEWKMKHFSLEARETLEYWALVFFENLDFLDGIDENGEVCGFMKLLDGENVVVEGKIHDNSLYTCFVKVL